MSRPRHLRRRGSQQLRAVVVGLVTGSTMLAGSLALADRVEVVSGVVTTYGDVVSIGDSQVSWAVQEWSADFVPSGVQGAPVPAEDVVVHVAPDGRDGGAGNASDPLQTLAAAKKAAEKANAAGRSVRVLIQAGTYREGIHLAKSPTSTDAPIIFEGLGRVIISGSDVVDDWSPVGGGIWSTPWDRAWGLDNLPPGWADSYAAPQIAANPVIRRRELAYVDGARMRPVTARAELESTAGSFLVDDAAGVLLLRPPAGVDPTRATVELGDRSLGFSIGFRQNVTLKNLTFEHVTSRMEQKAVQVNNSSDIALIDVVARENSWYGVGIFQSSDVIVLRLKANDNGVGGLTAFKVDDLLVQDSQTNRNNWRGIRGAEGVTPGKVVDSNYVDFAAGQKFFHLDGATFRGHEAADNLSSGLWFDYNNRNVVVEDSTIRGNRTWGVFFEVSPGPFTVRRSTITGNEYGILIANSSAGTITDSTIEGNTVEEIFVGGRDTRSATSRTGERYDVRSIDWTITGNRVGVPAGTSVVATHLATEPAARFFTSSTIRDNVATGR